MVAYRGEDSEDDNGGDGNGGDWDEYKKLVLSQIRELRHDNQEIRRDVSDFRSEVVDKFSTVKEDLARLNVKAGLWGALAGALFAGTSILIQMMSSK
jgi:hypothetical protein